MLFCVTNSTGYQILNKQHLTGKLSTEQSERVHDAYHFSVHTNSKACCVQTYIRHI